MRIAFQGKIISLAVDYTNLDVRGRLFNACFLFLLLQRVQAALPPQQHHMSVTMTSPRVVANPPVHENTPNWQQGATQLTNQQKANHHSMVQQQTNNHTKGQAPKRSHRDYIFGKVIGEGSFSTVYLAKDIHNGKECASKETVLFLYSV
jgi:hypothetical protein